ncbi:type IV fimbrial biogenesis protein FimT [Thermosulfidibacter takaii ABI70S6]|uniref:Type II secretion system protein H n=1 Tax=Thermosulfidibacter takaii (strain DSM 17441 / JCM 13301 / NBRC 103674 / ABI70S6) TaxID=1298851 RepID=A0A0S3QUS2_THET7|nr:GspH/FimT family pseudopilin [Thermosulfidibacter takaii]BAT72070.1 type IV fimbrial biogenesis protein FimT [Thermosulfidibacter takaii ABI70S6]
MKKGFSLIELIIVIALLAILAGLAIPSYRHWISKNKAEKDLQALYSMLQLARSKAFTEKECCAVRVLSTKAEIYCNNSTGEDCDATIATSGTKLQEIQFSTTIGTTGNSTTTIAFNKEGFAVSNTTLKTDNPYLQKCIVVWKTRIRLESNPDECE